MIKDERIISTRNKYLSHGFYIYFFLSLIAFYYRIFILGQKINEFWDLFIIFHLGTFYVFFNLITHGAWYAGKIKNRIIRICVGVTIGITLANYLRGDLNSFYDVFELILGLIIGFLIIIPVILYLNYWWKKRNELE